jgi:hypothetical protein
MFNKIAIFLAAVVFTGICFFHAFAMNGSEYKTGKVILAQKADEDQRPVFRITPRELDLGSVKPGETVFGEFHLNNVSPGTLDWSVSCPDEWENAGGRVINGVTSEAGDNLHVELSIAENIGGLFTAKPQISNYRAVMKMESAGQEIVCQKDVKSGTSRNTIRMTSTGGKRTAFVNFGIHMLQDNPLISLNPQRLDFGMHLPGKIISKKIELTNKGREILRWSVAQPKAVSVAFLKELQNGRFFSFHHDGIPEKGQYFIPEHLKDSMELLGEWTSDNGYPLSKGMASAIKFRFHGTGCSVYVKSHTESSGCSVYLDDILLKLPDMMSDYREKRELVIAEGLRNGPHSITIVSREAGLEFEGVRIFGKEIMQGPRNWITVYPNSGKTLTETDYVNVQVNTSNVAPGSYGDQIIFKSNSGEEKASIFIDVLPVTTHKNMDVYLYSKDLDYVFTLNDHVEAAALVKNGYIKEGIAFRLFPTETPGTASFYRWYNPALKDHYYHYDRSGGGKKLDGYFFECSIGNIATSRMKGTRELYRWVNPSTGRHYYSTDSRAASGVRKGYRFDGIAGYVK